MAPTLYRNKTDGASLRSMSERTHSRNPSDPPRATPSLGRHHTAEPSYSTRRNEMASSYETYGETRDSVNTYATSPSTSSEDFGSHRSFYSYDSRFQPESDAMPSTPPLFAQLFPSTRRLIIKHDDSVHDGNMNLRIDTNIAHSADPIKHVTLFYLCMKDLKKREMSLRRYGRECGREVVNYRRKFATPAADRPKLQRSGSNFMNSFRGKNSKEKVLQRQDSGYESEDGDSSSDNGRDGGSPTSPSSGVNFDRPTNTMLLEFSNYAHVQVKRRGGKGAKKYGFEYWGKSYAWKRKITMYGHDESYSYQLINVATNNVVAEIRPDNLSPSEVAEEQRRGGFVPPCTMWLCDDTQDSVVGSMTDLADVVVSTGIGALVDDCIKRKFSRRKRVVQLVLPTMRGNTVKMNMEYVGPKRLIDQVFNRPGSTSSKKLSVNTQQQQPQRPIPHGRSVSTRPVIVPATSYNDRMGSRPTPLRAATRV